MTIEIGQHFVKYHQSMMDVISAFLARIQLLEHHRTLIDLVQDTVWHRLRRQVKSISSCFENIPLTTIVTRYSQDYLSSRTIRRSNRMQLSNRRLVKYKIHRSHVRFTLPLHVTRLTYPRLSSFNLHSQILLPDTNKATDLGQ